MKERHKAVPAVYLILKKDDQILIARRCNTGYQDGNYHVPSGHVEEGELPIEALIREAKEEIGITLESSNVNFAHMLYRLREDQTGERVDLFFTAEHWSGEVKNMEPNKCDDIIWVATSNLPENFTPYVRAVIGHILQGVLYSEKS